MPLRHSLPAAAPSQAPCLPRTALASLLLPPTVLHSGFPVLVPREGLRQRCPHTRRRAKAGVRATSPVPMAFLSQLRCSEYIWGRRASGGACVCVCWGAADHRPLPLLRMGAGCGPRRLVGAVHFDTYLTRPGTSGLFVYLACVWGGGGGLPGAMSHAGSMRTAC